LREQAGTAVREDGRNQSFTYDALNRLTSAQNAGTDCSRTTINSKTAYWGNSYGYDAWGNLLQKSVTKCSAENLSLTALANNQLSGYSYDAAGNVTHDATSGLSYSYDQENRITRAAGYAYTYDGDGNRVKKSSGSTGTLYWYMSPGVVAESDLSGNLTSEYVFFDGERVARKDFPGGAVSYYFSDHLKTTDIVTDAQGNIKNESDFYPWGGELQFVNNDSNHYKFTGKERDSESGLDYFGARYYSNGLGRFITPDWAAQATAVPYAAFGDPQSLNLYSYGRNSPIARADADGHADGMMQRPRGGVDDGSGGLGGGGQPLDSPTWNSDEVLSGYNLMLNHDDNGVCYAPGYGPQADALRQNIADAKDLERRVGGARDESGEILVSAAGGKLLSRALKAVAGRLLGALGAKVAADSVETMAASMRITETMESSELAALRADIAANGVRNPLINYTEINGKNYVLLGNNRLQAARQLGITNQLKFERVSLPFQGFHDESDVLGAWGSTYRDPQGW
jgi:RHS repeat-associated protein